MLPLKENLIKFNSRFALFLQGNTWFLMFMLVFNITSIATVPFLNSITAYYNGEVGLAVIIPMTLAIISRLVFMIFLIVAVLSFIKNRFIHKVIQIVVVVASGILTFADIFTLYNYHQGFTDVFVYVILATNLQEGLGFLTAYGTTGLITAVVFTAIAGSVIIVGRFLNRHWQQLSRFVICMVAFCGVTVFSTLFFWPLLLENSFTAIERVAILIPRVYAEEQRFEESYHEFKNHDISISSNDSTIPTVVFVLGESTTRNHMGLYGYHLQTTPLL